MTGNVYGVGSTPTLEEINDESLRLQREELRRRYAIAALTGLLANPELLPEDPSKHPDWGMGCIMSAWGIADRMLEREKL